MIARLRKYFNFILIVNMFKFNLCVPESSNHNKSSVHTKSGCVGIKYNMLIKRHNMYFYSDFVWRMQLMLTKGYTFGLCVYKELITFNAN